MDDPEKTRKSYPAEIRVICNERIGLIMDISRVLSDEGLSVKAFNGRTTRDMTAIFNITIDITGKDQLELLIKRIRNIPDVTDIERVSG